MEAEKELTQAQVEEKIWQSINGWWQTCEGQTWPSNPDRSFLFEVFVRLRADQPDLFDQFLQSCTQELLGANNLFDELKRFMLLLALKANKSKGLTINEFDDDSSVAQVTNGGRFTLVFRTSEVAPHQAREFIDSLR